MVRFWEWASVTLGSLGVACLALSLLLVPTGTAWGQGRNPLVGVASILCWYCNDDECVNRTPPFCHVINNNPCTGILCSSACDCWMTPDEMHCFCALPPGS